jgi:hypothetical protein
MSQSDQPEPSGQHDRPSEQPLGDRLRAKLDEYDVERHLNDLATTVEGVVRDGMSRAGGLVHEHKDDIGGWIDRAAGVVDRRTEGKHADKISQVRGSLERGVDKIADQRHGGPPDSPASDVPPSNG